MVYVFIIRGIYNVGVFLKIKLKVLVYVRCSLYIEIKVFVILLFNRFILFI